MDGVELEFTNDALKEIAKHALKLEIGARGLKSILEKILEDAMFDTTSTKENVKIDSDIVTQKLDECA